MQVILSLQIDIICFIILSIILFNSNKVIGITAEQKWFDRVVIATMLILVCDSFMWVLEAKFFKYSREFYYLVCNIYFFLNAFIPFLWGYYATIRLKHNWSAFLKYRLLSIIPLLICVLSLLINAKNNMIFLINEDNIYVRGPFFFIELTLFFVYMLYSAFVALHELKHAQSRNQRKKCLLILIFLILPVLGTVIQSTNYKLSIIWPCFSLSLLIIFIKFQNQQLSTDALTGLNNRYQFDNYLRSKILDDTNHTEYTLIMIDVDKFKYINDTYGHICGDKALICVAEILKQSCEKYNAFLSRYGGDEFTIICSANNEPVVLEKINDFTKEFNQSQNETYSISLSIGSVHFRGHETHNADDILSQADQAMYLNKMSKKIKEKNLVN